MYINIVDGKITVAEQKHPGAVSCTLTDILHAIDGDSSGYWSVPFDAAKKSIECGEYVRDVTPLQLAIIEELHAVILNHLEVKGDDCEEPNNRDQMISILATELEQWPKNISTPSYTGWEWLCDYRGKIYLRSEYNFQIITELTWNLARRKPTISPSGATLSQFITIRIASLVKDDLLAETEVIVAQAIKDWNER